MMHYTKETPLESSQIKQDQIKEWSVPPQPAEVDVDES